LSVMVATVPARTTRIGEDMGEGRRVEQKV